MRFGEEFGGAFQGPCHYIITAHQRNLSAWHARARPQVQPDSAHGAWDVCVGMDAARVSTALYVLHLWPLRDAPARKIVRGHVTVCSRPRLGSEVRYILPPPGASRHPTRRATPQETHRHGLIPSDQGAG